MACLDRRLAGVLLHPTSLPGPHGSGDLGPSACHFVDWLAAARQNVWQVLPLTPVGPGHSPYASVSAFAGSPLLVAVEPLRERGWLDAGEAIAPGDFRADRVEFERVTRWRMDALRGAEAGFRRLGSAVERQEFELFCASQAHWLDDYALFMALDDDHRARHVHSWTQWAPSLALRDPAALRRAGEAHRAAIAFWRFVQWCFFAQWQRVKAYANGRGIRLVGDLPIFVAHHSADCWARPRLFQLDAALQPRVVAGVPPDAFSADGQRWGNPLYDWTAMAEDGYAWWIARLRHELGRADLVRIDHFRGFAGCWEIPASSPTAAEGRWVAAPGEALFAALRAALGEALPVIAEDLGVITPDVEALRDGCGLPGMKILQFGFGAGPADAFLPHNYPTSNCCVYTGSHDNDTVLGWWRSAGDAERDYAARYLGCDEAGAPWAMIRAAWASVARLAVCPMQDVLGLGSEHRMNIPGRLDCWTWRLRWEQVGPEPARRLAELTTVYGRASAQDTGSSARNSAQ
jgi:4-alpha-glucanotransferase